MAAETRDPLAQVWTVKHEEAIARYEVEFPLYVDSSATELRRPPEYVDITAGGRREVLRRTREMSRGQRATLNVSPDSTLPPGSSVTELKAATKPQYTWFLIRSQPHRQIMFAGLVITLLALFVSTLLEAFVGIGTIPQESPVAVLGSLAVDALTWVGALVAVFGIFYED
jgi:hypothetical protein